MKWSWLMLCLAACGGGQTGTPLHTSANEGDSDYCTPTLNDSTPLGITGAQLLALYGAPFEVTLQHAEFMNGVASAVEMDRVQLTLTHADEATTRSASCGQVALPVTVTVRGQLLNESGSGELVGSPELAYVNFRGEGFEGSVRFNGAEREVSLHFGDEIWQSVEAP